MSLLSFIKDAGEKLFNKPAAAAPAPATPAAAPAAAAPAAAPAADVAELNRKAGEAIGAYVQQQNLGVEGISVSYDGATGKATINGKAPTQEASEKAALCCGNVAHVASVDNLIVVDQPQPEAQFHDVAKGDTLSAIAKRYYGDARKYPVIFEANKPMLTHPDKIYPGQKLRIPAL